MRGGEVEDGLTNLLYVEYSIVDVCYVKPKQKGVGRKTVQNLAKKSFSSYKTSRPINRLPLRVLTNETRIALKAWEL